MYSYDDLFLFVKVVEVGSFTATAKLLKIGQSTVSRRMKELEEQLGLVLFRQHNKGYELTDAGKGVYNDLKNKRDGLDDLIAKHIKHKDTPHGRIKVALPNVLSVDLISPYLPDFLERYPEIDLDVCYQNQKIDLVKDGFNMAIVNYMPSQQTQKIKHVFTGEYEYYCTEEYKAKYGIPETPQQLQHHIVNGGMLEDYSVPSTLEFIDRNTGEVTIIDMPRRITVNNSIMTRQMLHSHKMIAGVLGVLNIEGEGIIRVLPDYQIAIHKFYMLKHPYENNLVTNLFCDFVEGLLKNAMLKKHDKSSIVS